MPIIFALAWSLSQVDACKLPRANVMSTPGPSGTQPPLLGSRQPGVAQSLRLKGWLILFLSTTQHIPQTAWEQR